jgi:hypothetical protein
MSALKPTTNSTATATGSSASPVGIDCRNETIRLQDESNDRLRPEVERLRPPSRYGDRSVANKKAAGGGG